MKIIKTNKIIENTFYILRMYYTSDDYMVGYWLFRDTNICKYCDGCIEIPENNRSYPGIDGEGYQFRIDFNLVSVL